MPNIDGKALNALAEIAGDGAITKSDLGLGNVDNTSDANKPVSTAVKGELDVIKENVAVNSAKVATVENVLNSMNPSQEASTTTSGVDTISLPKTASNAGMQVQLFGQSAQNLVVNGDFRNGTTGWEASNSTIAVSNSNLTITGTGASAFGSAKSTAFSGVNSGDKIYIYSRIRALNSKALYIRVRMANSSLSNTYGDASVSSPVENQWYPISGIISKAVAFQSYVILLQVEYPTTADALNSQH